MTARSQLSGRERGEKKKKLRNWRYLLLMRIIFRSHDRIDQRKNVRKGQMLPGFYRAACFFSYRSHKCRPFRSHVCYVFLSLFFFIPFLFYLLLRFAVKIMRKSRVEDKSDPFFRFHPRGVTMQNWIIRIKWSKSVYGQTLPFRASRAENNARNLNVRTKIIIIV